MCDPAPGAMVAPAIPDPLARADALLTLAESTLCLGPESPSTEKRNQVAVHVTTETPCGNANGCNRFWQDTRQYGYPGAISVRSLNMITDSAAGWCFTPL